MYKRAKKYAYKRSAYARRPATGINLLAKRFYAAPQKPLTNHAPMFPTTKSEELGTKDVSGTAVASTTQINTLLFVPTRTGNTYEDRHGDSTTIKTIRLRYTIKGPVAGATNVNAQWVRVVLYWDNQPNGAVPTLPLPFSANTVLSLMDPQYSYRFKILSDKRFYIAAGSWNLGNNDVCAQYEYFKNNLDLVSNYSGNAGTIADLTTGALHLFVCSDTAVVAGENPIVTFQSRVRFIS